eukprot:SAG31_NODE_2092_length_6464_cov_3.597172_3_plen_80_part_00
MVSDDKKPNHGNENVMMMMMMMMVFIDTLSVHHCLHTLLLFLYLAALAVQKFLSPLSLRLGPCSPFALFLPRALCLALF